MDRTTISEYAGVHFYGRKIPEGLRCPITKEPLVVDNFPVYRSNETGKLWSYNSQHDVFIEMSERGRVYSWDKNRWLRMKLKYFDASFGRTVSIGSKYTRYPRTNWNALVLSINNTFYTNKVSLGFLKVLRWILPKSLGFPMIKKVKARTVAMDLVPVQPMAYPESKLFTLDLVSDPGFTTNKTETKQQEHVIIQKEDQPKTNQIN